MKKGKGIMKYLRRTTKAERKRMPVITESSVTDGHFRNVSVARNSEPVAAITALRPNEEGMNTAYLVNNNKGGEKLHLDRNKALNDVKDKDARSIINRGLRKGTEVYRRGSVSIREVSGSRHGSSTQTREKAVTVRHQHHKSNGKDLGAGVVQKGRKRHISC